MLLLAADLALALAALTAWALVWSRREHEPIARFLMVVWLARFQGAFGGPVPV